MMKRGRPANPNRLAQQAKRRFLPLEKTPETLELIRLAHEAYQTQFGKDVPDAELIRHALREFIR